LQLAPGAFNDADSRPEQYVLRKPGTVRLSPSKGRDFARFCLEFKGRTPSRGARVHNH
jgi:hypothetical protein